MATIMPHGVLFRGGQEKVIRAGIVNDNVIEAIISLPPKLFYGTGIPACVLVINKDKPDALRDRILFINADREYAEGKSQNKLRPEDIEKIDDVFMHQRELDRYSRLVDKEEIVRNGYNLNIRRYVDNTPDPEPEDVHAHLLGGIPKKEVQDNSERFQRFRVDPMIVFKPRSEVYLDFGEEVNEQAAIKPIIEADAGLIEAYAHMNSASAEWWGVAREDFTKLAGNNHLAEVRAELLATIKQKLVPIGTLDEFQTAGVFVNWWQTIRYDLKTITSSGWSPSLIPDSYLIEAFFQAEVRTIEELEMQQSEAEAQLSDALDDVEYESGEDEEIKTNAVKAYLKAQIADLEKSSDEIAIAESETLDEQLNRVKIAESAVKQVKAEIKRLHAELAKKIEWKREGTEEEIEYVQALIEQNDRDATDLRANTPENTRSMRSHQNKLAALQRDRKKLEDRLHELRTFEVITPEESKRLILQKLYDLINNELARYLDGEKRTIIAVFEKLWEKYAASAQAIEDERDATLRKLNDYLTKLGYLTEGSLVRQQ